MIKFFSKIRQKLLQEGKITNYLKYAIGEIMLVVIGILIALSVNNWNGENKSHAKKKVYMQSLRDDLKADVTELQKRIADIKEQSNSDNIEKERLSGRNAIEDSLVSRVKRLGIFLYTYAEFNNSTFNSLRSSGEIDLLDEALKNELFSLNKMHEKARISYDIHFDKYLDNMLNFTSAYPTGRFTELDKGPLNDYLWDHYDYKELLIAYNKFMTTRRAAINRNLAYIVPVFEKSDYILKTYLRDDQIFK